MPSHGATCGRWWICVRQNLTAVLSLVALMPVSHQRKWPLTKPNLKKKRKKKEKITATSLSAPAKIRIFPSRKTHGWLWNSSIHASSFSHLQPAASGAAHVFGLSRLFVHKLNKVFLLAMSCLFDYVTQYTKRKDTHTPERTEQSLNKHTHTYTHVHIHTDTHCNPDACNDTLLRRQQETFAHYYY